MLLIFLKALHFIFIFEGKKWRKNQGNLLTPRGEYDVTAGKLPKT